MPQSPFLGTSPTRAGHPVIPASSSPATSASSRNVIERILILNPKAARIEAKHLPMLVQRTDGVSSSSSSASRSGREEFSTLQAAREAYERDYILKELDRTHGNISRAAEALGLERSHLYRKMKTHFGVEYRTLFQMNHELNMKL